MSLSDLAVDPASFFERRAADPSLRGPAAVVAVIALLGAVAALAITVRTLGSFPAGSGAIGAVSTVVAAGTALVTPFVVWLVYAAVFYGLSLLVDGDGSFRTLFTLVGWGFLPRVVAVAVDLLATGYVLATGRFPTDLTDPGAVQSGLATDPVMLAASAVGWLLLLASAYLWTHAVAAGRSLSVRRAALCVAPPVALALLVDLGATFLL